jgi:TonB family protein
MPPLRSQQVVIAGGADHMIIDKSMIRAVKSNTGNHTDKRFMAIALISIVAHAVFIIYVNRYHIAPPKTVLIEEMPERFAKLIIEKPIPKTEVQKKIADAAPGADADGGGKAAELPEKTSSPSGSINPAQKAKAQRSVNARTARVEQKIRTVGVLGMLTGVGTTARGPSVVDVLGTLKDRSSTSIDLDDALDKMTGLQKTKQIDVLDRKLVKSKDVAVSHKEDIDDLLANVGNAKSVDLVKQGSFIIQKPQSIEGAASSNAKRDNDAVSAIVTSHKASIRMSYEKYLKRDPTLAGKITIRFTIAAGGTIASVTVVDNSTGNTDLEDEIVRKIRMWQFEPIPDGDVTVTYPFVFAPAG